MRLADLEPRRLTMRADADERSNAGQGLSFICPHCFGQPSPARLAAFVNPPFDGGAPAEGVLLWTRTGDDFETLSLTPSYDASGHGHWHGFITNGAIT